VTPEQTIALALSGRREMPKRIERIDDGIILSLNEDGWTYSFDNQRECMPTTYYHYTLMKLLSSGAFRICEDEK
jgi:hypothetical protein